MLLLVSDEGAEGTERAIQGRQASLPHILSHFDGIISPYFTISCATVNSSSSSLCMMRQKMSDRSSREDVTTAAAYNR